MCTSMTFRMRRLIVAGALLAWAGAAGAAEITVGDTSVANGPLALQVIQGQVLNLDVYGLISSTTGDANAAGYDINVELSPQGAPTGTLQFTSGANDITELADPFGGGIFTTEDSNITGSPLLNDAAKTSPSGSVPLEYDGPLVRFPVLAGVSGIGTWDVRLTFSTTAAPSQWTPSNQIITLHVEGTITVVEPFCNNASDCVDGTCSAGSPNPGLSCSSDAVCGVGGTCIDNLCTDNVCSGGVCSNPNNSNVCDDGDLCTTADVCSGGACAGSPVVCLALDQCHVAGTCIAANAVCTGGTNDGTACVDDTACTGGGTCVGVCDNPNATDGTGCDDTFACTQTDTCVAGVCTGGNDVVCTALDQCHVIGVCQEPSGTCTNPNQTDGTACTDGDPCTLPDVCTNGICTSSSPACTGTAPVCQSLTCNATAGVCAGGTNDGVPCSDDTPCSGGGSCTVGICTGGANPGSGCRFGADCPGGTCDLACSTQAVSDGTACDDGVICTENDQCTAGACAGTAISGCLTCAADADCTASNPNPTCQSAVCNVGVCEFPSNGTCPTLTLQSVAGPTTCYDPVLTCTGGTNAGLPCTDGLDCPGGTCDPGALDPNTNQVVVNVVMTGMAGDATINTCLGGVNNGVACTVDNDCGAATGTCVGGTCSSGVNAGQACANDAACHVRCNKIVGGQFYLDYDQTKLEYQSIAPGPLFPFPLLFSHDAVNGTIDYSVSINLGDAGTSTDGSVMAAITFKAIAACDPDATVNFRTHTPPNNVVDTAGFSVSGLITDNMAPVRIDGIAPDFGITCPADISVHADAGESSAAIAWSQPIAVDACDGTRAVSCVKEAFLCSGSGAVCYTAADCPAGQTCDVLGAPLPIGVNGDTFAIGKSRVTCTATDACGNGTDAGEPCVFNVEVTSTNIMLVDVELAGADGDMLRCITFELSNCSDPAQPVVTVEAQMLFNGTAPSVATSRASGVSVEIPAGVYTCITARDRLHTLLSTETITDIGATYTASFDSTTGGTALRGGDFNDDGFKDIIDFAIMNAQFNTPVPANTNCLGLPSVPVTTADWNADLNGDGFVGSADFSVLNFNFGEFDAIDCCVITAGFAGDGPVMQIAVWELEFMGLGELTGADINGDGWVDMLDVEAFAAGDVPVDDDPVAPVKSLRRRGLRKR
ncbi:MAG: dockerin type I domain-containing protein [Phycisphaerae bacterium]